MEPTINKELQEKIDKVKTEISEKLKRICGNYDKLKWEVRPLRASSTSAFLSLKYKSLTLTEVVLRDNDTEDLERAIKFLELQTYGISEVVLQLTVAEVTGLVKIKE